MDTTPADSVDPAVEPLPTVTDHRADGIDLVTVSFPVPLPHERVRRLEEELEKALRLGPQARFLVLDGGAQLQVHRPLSSEILEEVKALRQLVDELVASKRRERAA